MTSFKTFKNYFLVVIILILNGAIMAQKITTKDIIGIYSLPSNNPEGGQSIAVFPDHTFSSVYFGGILKGSWRIKNNTVHFTIRAEPQIALYGRKLELLKDTIQLGFSGDFSRKANVNLNMIEGNTMRPIFNKDANCKSYPYIYKTTKGLKKISVAVRNQTEGKYSEKFDNFNLFIFDVPEDYNDLLVINLPSQYTTKNSFIVNYINGGLCFSLDDKPSRKRSLEIAFKEDLYFCKKVSTLKLLPEILEYGNEVFPYIDMDKADVIALTKPFYLIKPLDIISIKEKDLKIESKSLFTAKCD